MEKKKIYEPMRLPKTRKNTDRDRDYQGDLSWLWDKIGELEQAGWKRENYGWYIKPRRNDQNKKIEESQEYIVLSRTKNNEKMCHFAKWHNLKNREPLKYQGSSRGSNSCMGVHTPVLNPSLCTAENLPEFSALSVKGFCGGRKKRGLTDEETARIREMRDAGRNINDIAKELHISNRVISEFVKNN